MKPGLNITPVFEGQIQEAIKSLSSGDLNHAQIPGGSGLFLVKGGTNEAEERKSSEKFAIYFSVKGENDQEYLVCRF